MKSFCSANPLGIQQVEDFICMSFFLADRRYYCNFFVKSATQGDANVSEAISILVPKFTLTESMA